MKWVLVVLVASSPVKTDLLFNDLGTCLAAEQEMRAKWAEVYNSQVTAKASKETLDLIRSQMVSGTCIPTK
jgi:hypothetical protein